MDGLCCVECGGKDEVAMVSGITVCRKCLKEFLEQCGLESLIFDEVMISIFKLARRNLEMANWKWLNREMMRMWKGQALAYSNSNKNKR